MHFHAYYLHETFPTVSWCHTIFVLMAVCPKCCTNLYQEREKVPSLENASTTPMYMIIWCLNVSWTYIALDAHLVQGLNSFRYSFPTTVSLFSLFVAVFHMAQITDLCSDPLFLYQSNNVPSLKSTITIQFRIKHDVISIKETRLKV